MNDEKEEQYEISDYELIEIFKELKKIKSDNQAADRLGITKGFISNIKTKRKELSEAIVVEMARLAGPKITKAWGIRCEQRIRRKI